MKVTLIPSCLSSHGLEQDQYAIAYLINEGVAVDAGSLGFYGTPRDQAKIKDVFLSHTHADHLASLPIFVENAYEGGADPVTIHGSRSVLDCLRSDVFNGRIWPDFIGMTTPETPFLRLHEIEPGRPIERQGLRITPIAVDHLVPTLGFLIEDEDSAILIASDTGPTEELWRVARSSNRLRAVFLEASFPDEMLELARVSKHLTPALFRDEVGKLGRDDVDLIAVHIKPRYRAEIIDQLHRLGLSRLSIGRLGQSYSY